MENLKIKRHPDVPLKFESYPTHVLPKMEKLRQLIIDVASKIDGVLELEETLKWGEPSYIVKRGSTIRMDWKPKNPEQYALYFNCNTSLVETFKALYSHTFRYEKNRAILFDLSEEIPVESLKECIGMALQYHSLKHLHFLGK